ncbi:Gfo/Idh/MocA family protein [Alicyclobacillus sp. SO9]|uniref:Gfo/Idh/MocA family protein n=1 Tax=Alicyclobacillus sp. SO9 TaxID=2665646 RepID=UPI0018E7D304|nr:Gfo/Idh/MocA family oxidoreductase [Alicyclobacillus sp. SO9]QQE78259.1 Gfo/Idh/MocA family oxidoreductase [Alicyclobacillus sp. SO9]
MKALIIGYGSIGRRHARILHQLNYEVIVVSSRGGIKGTSYPISVSTEQILERTIPDYVVIANETDRHYQTLRQIRRLGFTGPVLVEKPLFGDADNAQAFDLSNTFAGYNLRFHPVLLRLKKLVQEKSVISAHLYVGQYLPAWRSGDYRRSYSASQNRGGGVLRDLSHELDFVQWLFGPWQQVAALGGHFSTLQIDSDDVFALLLSTQRCPVVSVQLNYVDRLQQRQVIVNTDTETYAADLIQNTLTSTHGTTQFQLDLDITYKLEHMAAILQDDTVLCSAEDALQTDELIASAAKAAQEGRWVHR